MADSLEHARVVKERAEKLILQSDKLASIGQLAAGIGHELNNPLGNILSYSKLLERELKDGDAQLRHDVESLREEALRASKIIKGVLNFARQVPPSMTCFELRAWLGETLSLVTQAARDRGVQLVCTMQDDLMVEGDQTQLQQALVNLLLNAIHASKTGDIVTLSVSVSDSMFTIQVDDTAGGMDEEILKKVFDPFFSTKAEGEGTGLGLSISLGIVERHGGQLLLANNDQGGTSARMILPLEQNDE
jgi:two-component system NtrC family sensor kinase